MMRRIACLMILAAVFCVSAHATNGDPLVGRWSLDVVASSFSSERPPMTEWLTITPNGVGLAIDLTAVDSRGQFHGLKVVAPLDASDADVAVLPLDDKPGTHGPSPRFPPWVDKMTLEMLTPQSAR